MAEKPKKPLKERAPNVLKKVHYGLGGAALIGAELLPPAAAALTAFAVWEGAHGLFWGWLEKKAKGRGNK